MTYSAPATSAASHRNPLKSHKNPVKTHDQSLLQSIAPKTKTCELNGFTEEQDLGLPVDATGRGLWYSVRTMSEKKITEADVRHVAKLSRLRLDDDEIHHFTEQLESVLEYIGKLNELDVEGVEPMAHAMDMSNVLREDKEQDGIATDDALRNAPASDGAFFEVPKVLGDGSGA